MTFFDDNADIFAASLLMAYFRFLSVVMTSFYILSKRLCLKRKGLSDARVVLFTKKEYVFPVHFL